MSALIDPEGSVPEFIRQGEIWAAMPGLPDELDRLRENRVYAFVAAWETWQFLPTWIRIDRMMVYLVGQGPIWLIQTHQLNEHADDYYPINAIDSERIA